MKITRNNYEAFFILYLDNELDPETRAEVEAFAMVHPDLGEELELLLQTRFVPDEQIQFADKSSLLKSTATSSVNSNNYEEWMLMQADGELNATQQSELMTWLAQNPSYQKEMDLLLRTRLEADTSIVFPNKESLYRHEEPKRATLFTWRRIAVAASLLLAISTTALIISNPGNNVTQPGGMIADQQNTTQRSVSSTKQADQPSNTEANLNNELNADPALVNEVADNSGSNFTAKETNRQTVEETLQAERRSNANNLPGGEQNPNLLLADNNVKVNSNETAFASYDELKFEAPVNTPLTNSKEINYTPTVTSQTLQPLEPVYALQEDAVFEEPGRKNKFRGFLRKVTRTFEKTTNLRATDADDRLLIGALAIQL